MAIPLYLLIYLKADFRFAQETVAGQVAAVSRLLGNPAVAEGYLVKSSNVILEVIEACVAWKDVFAFIALVIAVPNRSAKEKAFGIIVGSLVMYLANLARLVTVLFVAVRIPAFTEVVHSVLWKFGMISLILLVWLSWMRLTSREKGINKTVD
ncbi:MAG: archaeosortase/exosortase family protein [archaeon]